MLGAVARGTPFFVEDASGRVRVNPEGAGVDGRRVYDDFKEQPAQARMKLGGKTVDLNYGLETRGYRMYEDILSSTRPSTSWASSPTMAASAGRRRRAPTPTSSSATARRLTLPAPTRATD